jgi:hypothetical protein
MTECLCADRLSDRLTLGEKTRAYCLDFLKDFPGTVNRDGDRVASVSPKMPTSPGRTRDNLKVVAEWDEFLRKHGTELRRIRDEMQTAFKKNGRYITYQETEIDQEAVILLGTKVLDKSALKHIPRDIPKRGNR